VGTFSRHSVEFVDHYTVENENSAPIDVEENDDDVDDTESRVAETGSTAGPTPAPTTDADRRKLAEDIAQKGRCIVISHILSLLYSFV